MKQQKGCVHPGDHYVLIVARVTEKRLIRDRISRQVFKLAVAFDPEFDWVTGGVSLRATVRPVTVNRVQIEQRVPGVRRRYGRRWNSQPGYLIKRHVMVKELTEKGYSSCMSRIVPVDQSKIGVHDQRHGTGCPVVECY